MSAILKFPLLLSNFSLDLSGTIRREDQNNFSQSLHAIGIKIVGNVQAITCGLGYVLYSVRICWRRLNQVPVSFHYLSARRKKE